MTSNPGKLDLIEFKLSDKQRAFVDETNRILRAMQPTIAQVKAMAAADEVVRLAENTPPFRCRCHPIFVDAEELKS